MKNCYINYYILFELNAENTQAIFYRAIYYHGIQLRRVLLKYLKVNRAPHTSIAPQK